MAGAVGIVFGLCVLSFTLGAALMYVLVRRREEAAQDNTAPSEAPAEPKWAGRTWVDKPMAVEPVDADYETRPIHRNAVVGLPHLEPALATLAEPVAHRTADRAPGRAAAPAARAMQPAARLVEPAEPQVAAPAVDPAAQPIAKPAEPLASRAASAVSPAARLVGEPAEVVAEPKTVGAARYDRDGDLDPPLGEVEAPESSLAASTDSPGVVAEGTAAEPVSQFVQDPATRQLATQPAQHSATPSAEQPATQFHEELLTQPEEQPTTQPAQEPAEPPEPRATRTTLPPPATPQPAEHTTWVEREDFRQRYLRTFEEVRRRAGSN
ncbi:hypothetical protein [Lentzea sp. HUAS12]|uniref:hypothetical protein n=1 Tax=Lentzea sp. HUAS12 TaxID=2951806 RepID=UPI0020A184BB|nr:hypothetical protein [Lentzea sp. HUAS12]USX51368.1 hypothetical protein ND450_39400 [Lentzea sp. HUAS12]